MTSSDPLPDAADIDWFVPPSPHGSAQCPVCGRFSRIVRASDGGGSIEDGYAVVECPKHGRGIA